MSTVLTDNSNYSNIANAIRTKNGSATTYTPAEMSNAILNIPTGLSINGDLVEYSTDYETILAGDFVQLTHNGDILTYKNTQEYSDAMPGSISCLLPNNQRHHQFVWVRNSASYAIAD